jgi:arylsulfatase A-like enzyme
MSMSKLSRLWISLLAGLAALALAAPSLSAAEQPVRPHIVYFLADDLGWSDIGFHGSTIATPNLDRLASQGVKLEQFYVQPLCTPTRASLMTGRYPIRYGLQVSVVRPWADYGLPLEERMLPQVLREAGYFTAIVGKWHLGHARREYLPTNRGFDHQYGLYNGGLDYWTHIRLPFPASAAPRLLDFDAVPDYETYIRGRGLDWHRNDRGLEEEGYATDLIAAEARRIVERHDDARPLFLYVPFNAPHSPLQAPDEYLERYRQVGDQRRRAYSAMVTALDDAVGRVIEAIDRRGWRERTLFVFSSDNGGPLNLGATNGELRDGKNSIYEGGVRVPAFLTWRDVIPAGSVSNEPLHMVDLYPTLIKLAGGSLEQPLPLDGRDAWPTILGRSPSPHEEILHQREPGRGAIRVGDWKLVVHDGSMMRDLAGMGLEEADERGGAKLSVELFNLADDPYERTNLAGQNPLIVEDLQGRLAVYTKAAVAPKGGTPPRRGFKLPKVWGEPDESTPGGS